MQSFESYNPLVVTVYFLLVVGIAMFCMNPIILSFSFLGALFLYFARNGLRNGKIHCYFFCLFCVLTLINPLVSHNGVTVLFVMNNNPITLEALIYGAATAGMIISVVYWFCSFSQIMTSDKLLYIFGAFSPKLALILSMSLRYVPLFQNQTKKINQAQKALGLYKEDNIVDNFKGGLWIFSVLITWALENGIITADSMTARGYGIGKRSRYAIFRFQKEDMVLLSFSIFLFMWSLFGIRQFEFTYYPAFTILRPTSVGIAGYAAYGILVLLPTIVEIKERVRWKYLRSKV